jgi:2-iminobutanoate/2-iminopropanoate deaminase
MTKKTFIPKGAVIVGPYSPAVEAGNLVYFSGQIPIDSSTGKIIDGDIKAQTSQCLKNLSAVLEAAGVESDDVVKTTVYLTEMADYAAVNEVYGEYFNAPYPARTAIAVSALPLGAKVEIEVIANKYN